MTCGDGPDALGGKSSTPLTGATEKIRDGMAGAGAIEAKVTNLARHFAHRSIRLSMRAYGASGFQPGEWRWVSPRHAVTL